MRNSLWSTYDATEFQHMREPTANLFASESSSIKSCDLEAMGHEHHLLFLQLFGRDCMDGDRHNSLRATQEPSG